MVPDVEWLDAGEAHSQRRDDGEGRTEDEVTAAASERAAAEEGGGCQEKEGDPPSAGKDGDGEDELEGRSGSEDDAEGDVELLHGADAKS